MCIVVSREVDNHDRGRLSGTPEEAMRHWADDCVDVIEWPDNSPHSLEHMVGRNTIRSPKVRIWVIPETRAVHMAYLCDGPNHSGERGSNTHQKDWCLIPSEIVRGLNTRQQRDFTNRAAVHLSQAELNLGLHRRASRVKAEPPTERPSAVL